MARIGFWRVRVPANRRRGSGCSDRKGRSVVNSWIQRGGCRVKLVFLRLPDTNTALSRVRQRVRQGGHSIPDATVRRRFERGWRNFSMVYRDLVDEWAVFDALAISPLLLDAYPARPLGKMMEPSESRPSNADTKPGRSKPSEGLDIEGIEAALRRASEVAIARARAAGLEPIVRWPDESESVSGREE